MAAKPAGARTPAGRHLRRRRPGARRWPGLRAGRITPGTGSHWRPGKCPQPSCGRRRGTAELVRRAAEFPGHDITHETTPGGSHYVAQGRDLSTHPYLVMSSNLSKLFAALAAA
jgi:hypothetical protein